MTELVLDPPAAPPPALPRRLRVLSGRLTGAEHPLPADRSITIGHSYENDVVLRGTHTIGLAAELHMSEGAAMLRVRSGSLVALGREIRAGEEVMLPSYLPVRLGEFAIAIGGEDDDRWAEAQEQTAQFADPIVPAARARPRARAMDRLAARVAPWRRIGAKRIAAVAAGGAVLFGAISAVPLAGYWREIEARDPAAVRSQLATAGFGALTVIPDAGGAGVLITGTVGSDRDADRLQAYAAENFPGSLVEVDSTAALAAAASDTLRANGIKGEARALGAGAIAIDTDYLPVDRQREVSAMLRRDIPALRRIDYRLKPGSGSDELRHFFNSPQYGAAGFVDGNPGYIVTADGSRWFAGAMLPTGHRLVSVGQGRVTLERGGQIEVLTM
jgi:type III secretion protein D